MKRQGVTYRLTSILVDPAWTVGGGGGLKRGGADCRRSCPGEGAGGGHPSRPARVYGGALEAPPSGSGVEPQMPALFALKNYAKTAMKI